ncbi:hypothetical protein [Polycladidibacter stylochi]|uniref:hypothetical protein n=1 Tax=Polycladidibacter stylochi TaxID=1807766 RepID=UPI000835B0B0|nr:hypothetical protein [Pseudovibrio stylochi]
MGLKSVGLLICCLLFLCISSRYQSAKAIDLNYEKQSYPNLLGTWKAIRKDAIFWHRDTINHQNSASVLIISKQSEAMLEAELHWQHVEGKGPDHNGQFDTLGGKEQLIGLIGWDLASIHFAQHPNSGVLQGQILNNEALELTRVEAGPFAVVERYIFIRQASSTGAPTPRSQ